MPVAGARPALEADLVADLRAQPPAALLGHPPGRRPGGDAPRLEHHDALAAAGAGGAQGRRRQGRLAAAGRRHEHRACGAGGPAGRAAGCLPRSAVHQSRD
jgi:hypothetical protein